MHWHWVLMETCPVGAPRRTLATNGPTCRSCPGLRTGRRRHPCTFDQWLDFCGT